MRRRLFRLFQAGVLPLILKTKTEVLFLSPVLNALQHFVGSPKSAQEGVRSELLPAVLAATEALLNAGRDRKQCLQDLLSRS